MARIIVFPSYHEKQKRSGKCTSAFFPKNNEGRSMLLWELNRMFCHVQEAEVWLSTIKPKPEQMQTQPNEKIPKTNKQTKIPINNNKTRKQTKNQNSFIVDAPYIGIKGAHTIYCVWKCKVWSIPYCCILFLQWEKGAG